MKFANFILLSAAFAVSTFDVCAQTAAVADLQQDMAQLKYDVGKLRLEVEQLRRENEALAQRLRSVQTSSVGSETVRQQVSVVKSEVAAQNEALKREIVSLVRKDLEAMASQTNTNIRKIAAAVGNRPQAELPTNFSDNYPKTGITYTVQSGDSISKIARKHNSKIKWIQDANKIADPSRGLRVGDEIFVPQQ